MHQQMKSLLDERKEGKYIIFCGTDHLLSNRDVPSIMQIAGNNTLSMVVSDKNDVKHANDHYTKPDVLMVINPHSKAVNTTTRQPTVQEHSFFRPDPAKIVTIHSISRDEAKLALQNTAPGTYLVRFPSSRGELVLSMKTARNIDHIVIDKREGKYSVEFDNRGNDLIQANSLNELIEELKRTKILLEEKVLAPKPASP